MNEFFDLITKIEKDHLLKVKCNYSWRKGWRVRVYQEGVNMPVIHVMGVDKDKVFDRTIKELLERYF